MSSNQHNTKLVQINRDKTWKTGKRSRMKNRYSRTYLCIALLEFVFLVITIIVAVVKLSVQLLQHDYKYRLMAVGNYRMQKWFIFATALYEKFM